MLPPLMSAVAVIYLLGTAGWIIWNALRVRYHRVTRALNIGAAVVLAWGAIAFLARRETVPDSLLVLGFVLATAGEVTRRAL